MSFLRQFLAILQLNLASLAVRLGLTSTSVIGVTCAVGVLISMLAMGTGARRQALADVRDDRVIFLSAGATSAMQSNISRDAAGIIRELPGLRRNSANLPIVVDEVAVALDIRRRSSGARISVPIHGVSGDLLDLRPELHLTGGRLFNRGLRELIVSDVCVREYADLALGDRRAAKGGEWTIVGVFDSPGGTGACTVYADGGSIMSAFKRDNYNQVTAMLQTVNAYSEVEAALARNPILHVEVRRERNVVESEFREFNQLLDLSSYFVGAIMACGATVGMINSLYAVIDTRRRDLATVRAIGFSPGPILAALIFESALLSALGGLLGVGLAWLLFNGVAASSEGFEFRLFVTSALIALGIGWAVAIGVLSAVLPAARAVRTSVMTALSER